ncbi:hypothetical protein L6452_18181 [Arctium lappa]|uniref:Uncharacterized protein n=1 Tax=Arctium lappa TaxID=4217 RepID=A0ACB9C5I2_ARCLA|nr:hypothetical protein L6452_18181 [Arctium lappa]
MKMTWNNNSMGSSTRRISTRGFGVVLKEQKARLYIIRRCVVMLLYKVMSSLLDFNPIDWGLLPFTDSAI